LTFSDNLLKIVAQFDLFLHADIFSLKSILHFLDFGKKLRIFDGNGGLLGKPRCLPMAGDNSRRARTANTPTNSSLNIKGYPA
jgi:hypothetical protein